MNEMYEVSWKLFGDRYFLVNAESREEAPDKVKALIRAEIDKSRDYGVDEWDSGVAGYMEYAGIEDPEYVEETEVAYDRDGIVEICE